MTRMATLLLSVFVVASIPQGLQAGWRHGHGVVARGYGVAPWFSLQIGGCGTRFSYYLGGGGWPSPYGIYYNASTRDAQFYLPPIFAPAELLYGPQALNRFMGIPQAAPLPQPAPPAQAPAADAIVAQPKVRESNASTLNRAQRFVEFGDALFRQQQYHQALQRYKSAAEVAPDLAEAYLRQGHALLATHRYDLALKAFRAGFQLNPDVARGGFQLNDLYGPNQIAKTSHLEALARDALEDPLGDTDLIFLVGLVLYYDGQTERATGFFQHVLEVAPDHRLALRFVTPPQFAQARPNGERDL